jgi:lipopolysaccharide heptosyltransferase II
MRFDPQRILIVLHGSIGDVTRALPVANLLRRGFPKAMLAWAVEPASFPLLEKHPAVNEVIVFDRNHWWTATIPFLRTIRSRRFDLVLDLQRHLKSGLISWWSGAPQRVGFHKLDCKEFNWIFNNLYIAAIGDSISKLDHYLKFVEYLGIEAEPIEWKIKLVPQEESGVARHLARVHRDFAVLFVGSRWESKRWFASQIAACAREIERRYGLDAVLLGSKEDVPLAEQAEAQELSRVVNLTGQTSLREAIGIVAKAAVAVGPDTGLMHIAAAVRTPVVSLWGATSPLRTGPYGFEHLTVQGHAECSPCYLRRCPIGRVCMQSIDIEEVAAKVGLALARRSQRTHRDGVEGR